MASTPLQQTIGNFVWNVLTLISLQIKSHSISVTLRLMQIQFGVLKNGKIKKRIATLSAGVNLL